MRYEAPPADSLEVSLFGGGVGECVVVHLGFNEWLIADCCVNRETGVPAAVEYLDRIGVDAAQAVKLVVATHWHDDHVRGLSELLRRLPEARLACSQALLCDEFKAVVASRDELMIRGSSGIDEMFGVIRLLRERRTSGQRPEAAFPDEWASSNKCLLRLQTEGRSFPSVVHSLSPSPGAVTLAYQDLGALLAPGPKKRLISSANHVSVALWVEVGAVSALLGADLEEPGRPGEGWTAVIRSPGRPPGRATYFKVPHHGSPNADCPDVWTQLLEPEPTVAVAPYSRGSRPRPSDADLRRLRGRSESVFVTRAGATVKPKRRVTIVEKEMATRKRYVLETGVGHVRVRHSAVAPVGRSTVELANGAFQVL